MKRKRIFMTLLMSYATLLMSYATLHAQPEISDFGSESITEEQEGYPFFIEVFGDAIGKAKIDKSPFEGHIQYREIEASLNAIFLYNPTYKEGFYSSIGYDYTVLDWSDNLFFNKKIFDTVFFSLGAFTERAPGWFLNSYVSVNMDTDHFNFGQYTTYDILLWGRYAYNCNFGLHAGFLALVGLNMNHVYPILGFDWTINKSFKLNAVFPMNMAAVYTLDNTWSFALAARFFDSRHRVNKHAPLPKGIFNYKTYGTELAVNYNLNDWIKANLHAGYTWGGVLKIANENNSKSKHIDFGLAPYFGAEFQLKF